MKLLKESLIIFFWVMVIVGSLGAIIVSYFIFCERYGILWPTVGLVWFYLASVLMAWLNDKIRKGGKKNEVRELVPSDHSTPSAGSVVKLDDVTVAQAVREASARKYDGPDGAA